ncbi:MAG: transcription repressor NadR [Eubacteriales bacterium]
MMASERKHLIVNELKSTTNPVSATQLARKLGVSRQVIVGDVAILRASGEEIIATPRGYLLQKQQESHYSIACRHTSEQMLDELYTIVDNGCSVLDVIVEHQVYGQLVGKLHICSRKDADAFVENLHASNQEPLSSLTERIHLHTLGCPSAEHYEMLKEDLLHKGYLIQET